MPSPTGDVTFRRYREVATLSLRPLASSTSVRNGDRVYARLERVMSTLTGAPGSRAWEEEDLGAQAGNYGNGTDGALDLAAPLTITRDMFYTTGRVRTGGTLNENGFRAYFNTSLQIDAGGNVNNNGNAAVGVTGGVATTLGTFAAGTAGGNGGSNGVGSAGTNDSATAALTRPAGGVGGTGAAGGANAGGVGGTVTTNDRAGSLNLFSNAIQGATQGIMAPGTGGGGGGSDNAGGHGGGGGGGAGPVFLAAPEIVNNGTITATGGAGGPGVVTGNSGGGGGGGGGPSCIVTRSYTGSGTVVTTGGAGGAGAGTGVAGAAGAAGSQFTFLQ